MEVSVDIFVNDNGTDHIHNKSHVVYQNQPFNRYEIKQINTKHIICNLLYCIITKNMIKTIMKKTEK